MKRLHGAGRPNRKCSALLAGQERGRHDRTQDYELDLRAECNGLSPINPDGSYKMFDRHHLTEKAAMELLPYMRESIRWAIANRCVEFSCARR